MTTSEATYTELPLPQALHPDRVLYGVTLEGFENPWQAQLIEKSQAQLANVDQPFNYPELQPGQLVRDFIPQFSNPTINATGTATIRGWKILEGPFRDQVCYEIPEAACCTRARARVTGVYLWCASAYENGRLGEHGAIFGKGQVPDREDDGSPILPGALTHKPMGKRADGACPSCRKRTEDGTDWIEDHAAIADAIHRRNWYITGR